MNRRTLIRNLLMLPIGIAASVTPLRTPSLFLSHDSTGRAERAKRWRKIVQEELASLKRDQSGHKGNV